MGPFVRQPNIKKLGKYGQFGRFVAEWEWLWGRAWDPKSGGGGVPVRYGLCSAGDVLECARALAQ